MSNVFIVTINYTDELNNHNSVKDTFYETPADANHAAWETYDRYLDDLVEYWDKRGDEDKTNRYTKFIREIKDLKIKAGVDEAYARNDGRCHTYFANVGDGHLVVSVKQLKEAV